jgi:hypothetical protein
MLCSNTVGEEHCIGHKHYNNVLIVKCNIHTLRGRRGRDRIVVGFTATYGIIAYHHWCCEFEYRSGRGLQHYVIK